MEDNRSVSGQNLSKTATDVVRVLLSTLPDKKSISDFFLFLRCELRGTPDDWMLEYIYQQLIIQGHPLYEGYLIEFNHDRNPSLSYTEDEFLKLAELDAQDDPIILGMIVKAVQSNRQLFDKHVKLLKGLLEAKPESKDVSDEYRMWLAVLEIDPVMNYEPSKVDRALALLNDKMTVQTDSYILIRYLDRVARLSQVDIKRRDYKKALGLLNGCGKRAEWTYYHGIFSLCDANYDSAYQSFCRVNDRRCRLAQAYCLINGIGTDVNHDAARAILKDFPEDGYALYLLAASLYKCRENPMEIPPEVSELLEESYKLGYKPAMGTTVLMLIDCMNRGKEPVQVNEMCRRATELESPDKDGIIHGCICYMAYTCIAAHISQLSKERTADTNNDERKDSVAYALYAFRKECERVSPMSAYLRASLFQLTMEDNTLQHWITGLNCLNQSPFVRRWALRHALVNAWMCGHDNMDDMLISYFAKMGASEKDIEVMKAGLALKDDNVSEDTLNAKLKEFCETYDKPEATPLAKQLLAGIYVNVKEYLNPEFVRRTIEETKGTEDDMVFELRAMNIIAAQLQEEYEEDIHDSEFNESSDEWLEHFIGYNFFDYNG